ncbi:MAG: type toxin-antitoxin system RelE/ParE family toxin [Caulobacter sp.]|nr:type toxin-antitoxin system RelE/ParE family toxin [Caulobacter sp.]
MRRPVVVSPKARRDFGRLGKFLATKSPAAAERALNAMNKGIDSLDMMPECGRPLFDQPEIRELSVPFGSGAYLIHYRVEPTKVRVVAIFHSREAR